MASAAAGSTVSLSQQNSADTFNGGGNAHVRVSTPDANALAGGFRLTDGVNDLVAWCLDLLTELSFPGGSTDYTATATPFSNTSGGLSAATVGNIESLFETAYSTLDLNDDAQSAGFQLALWEVVYESDAAVGFSLSNGTFQQVRNTGAANAAEAAANGFLAGLGGPVTQEYRLTFFESSVDGSGDQISQNLVSVTPVPLPAAAWMLGLCLAGLAGLGRRRKA